MIPARVLLLLVVTMQASGVQQRPPSVGDESTPFVLGVLRRDGIVSPFAVFDGKNWTAPWPTDLRSLELPIGLESVPRKWWGKGGAVSQMTAWVDGVNRGTLRLTRPAMVRLMCASRLGLSSDYRSPQPAPPPDVQPYPKDGLAVSGVQRVEPIDVMSPASSEWAPAAGLLLEPFDKAEQAAIDGFRGWQHPVRRVERGKVPVELEAMYRAPMDRPGWVAYYVEAIKRYPPGPDDGDCGLMTSAGGWVVIGPDGKRSTKLTARVTYCDRRGVTYMLPLGLIKAQGRTYWAYQISGYGREGYGVLRPTPKELVAEVQYSAGSCPF
jgi:hypothetical protein